MNKKTVWGFAFALASLLFVSCTPGIRLDTKETRDTELAGTYTVIFYGCNYLGDLETIVFLDREGDQYEFEPYAPDFKFRVKKGVPAGEALSEAKKFLSCNQSYRNAQLSRIVTPGGDTVGYEVRPLHYPFIYGLDVLERDYRIKDNKVVITIRLTPSADMLRRDGSVQERAR